MSQTYRGGGGAGAGVQGQGRQSSAAAKVGRASSDLEYGSNGPASSSSSHHQQHQQQYHQPQHVKGSRQSDSVHPLPLQQPPQPVLPAAQPTPSFKVYARHDSSDSCSASRRKSTGQGHGSTPPPPPPPSTRSVSGGWWG